MHPVHPLHTPTRRRRSELDDVLAQAREAILTARAERDQARSATADLRAENQRLRRALEAERSRPAPAPAPEPPAEPALERARRLEADLENVRRQKDIAIRQARRDALAEVADPLVAIVGQLGRALASNPDPDSDWFRGTAAVLARTRSAIERLGLSLVDQVGVPFDPDRHDAIGTVQTADLAPDTVADVIEAGLRTHDGTLIRAAKVLVSHP
jgi:molecular chaperone GrpE